MQRDDDGDQTSVMWSCWTTSSGSIVVALGVRLLGNPPVDDVASPVADVHRVVTDAFVEAGDHRELHGDLEVDVAGSVALEDHLDELAVQIVEVRVHVVQGCGAEAIARRDTPRSPP